MTRPGHPLRHQYLGGHSDLTAALLTPVAYALAAIVLASLLRPDPLLLARSIDADQHPGRAAPAAASAHGRPGVLLGALVMVLTQ
jgi:hypothetical protein